MQFDFVGAAKSPGLNTANGGISTETLQAWPGTGIQHV